MFGLLRFTSTNRPFHFFLAIPEQFFFQLPMHHVPRVETRLTTINRRLSWRPQFRIPWGRLSNIVIQGAFSLRMTGGHNPFDFFDSFHVCFASFHFYKSTIPIFADNLKAIFLPRAYASRARAETWQAHHQSKAKGKAARFVGPTCPNMPHDCGSMNTAAKATSSNNGQGARCLSKG